MSIYTMTCDRCGKTTADPQGWSGRWYVSHIYPPPAPPPTRIGNVCPACVATANAEGAPEGAPDPAQ